MTNAADEKITDRPGLRFNIRELAGSFGDLGTFLPLTVALAVATDLNFGWMLVAAGLMNIATGLLFRLPIPVQPMKAIAAVAIAEGLTGGAVVAAGWMMGIVLTLIAVTGLIPIMDKLVPRPVVRAIQLGIGIKLLINAFKWLQPLPWLGTNSVLTAAVFGVLLLVGVIRGWPMVLPVFAAGFAIIAIHAPGTYQSLALRPPEFAWVSIATDDWINGLFQGMLPQLPLTLLNSVLAVCALSGDYFPKHPIPQKKMALSVGIMNLLCIGWSGLPMCHGSGGLAAQYRAGARSGGSVVMLGGIKVVLGLAFGVSLLPLLAVYPAAVLAPLIALAGLSLAYAGWSKTKRSDWLIVLPATATIVLTQTLYGFIVGIVISILWISYKMRRGRASNST